MIVINIVMPIRPEKTDEWLALADSYAKDVNSEEGCLFFKFSRSLTDENEYVCIEGFRDADAGAVHTASEHFQKAVSEMPDWVSANPQIMYVDSPELSGWGAMGEVQPRS